MSKTIYTIVFAEYFNAPNSLIMSFYNELGARHDRRFVDMNRTLTYVTHVLATWIAYIVAMSADCYPADSDDARYYYNHNREGRLYPLSVMGERIPLLKSRVWHVSGVPELELYVMLEDMLYLMLRDGYGCNLLGHLTQVEHVDRGMGIKESPINIEDYKEFFYSVYKDIVRLTALFRRQFFNKLVKFKPIRGRTDKIYIECSDKPWRYRHDAHSI